MNKGKAIEHKLVTTGEKLRSCLFKGNVGLQKTIFQLVTRSFQASAPDKFVCFHSENNSNVFCHPSARKI